MKENILCISRASLGLKRGVTIDKTKDHIQAYLWKKECFMQSDLVKDPNVVVKETLDYLLKEFSSDLQYANKENRKIVFYFAE